MTAQDMKFLLERAPFIPLRIHLTGGEAIEIAHPEFVTLFWARLEIAIPYQDDRTIMDHAVHVALAHITRIEELVPA